MNVRGYASGAWDMFHIGHLNLLRRARELCDVLIAGVAPDEVLIKVKGRPAVVPLAERIAIVSALAMVDKVVIDGDKLDVWRAEPFDVIFKGDDWRGTAKGDQLERDMTSVGVRVHYFPYTSHLSTTKLRERLSTL